MVGGVLMAMSRGRGNVRSFSLFQGLSLQLFLFEIEQNREKVQARRSGNVTVLTDKNMGLIWPFSRLRKTSKIGPGWVLFIWYLF